MKIDVNKLLGRPEIELLSEGVMEFYKSKTILVTGGGGSVGSELVRTLAKTNPKKIIILDIYENNAFDLAEDLKFEYGSAFDLTVLIGSVRDESRLEEIFSQYRPEVVFHAAAHKHVPLMEDSGVEALKNNVIGTYNTANIAEKYGVELFVLISTDKAVNPTSIMGASKRLCEQIISCRTDSSTRFVSVRFGNVFGSAGSVVPLFKRQIENGGPVTITDKRMVRFFMTLKEAATLLLETGVMAERGDVFVLDMGDPVNILSLAEKMICEYGLVPNLDIEIKEVGLRPGEKLYEELLINSDKQRKTSSPKIFIEQENYKTRAEMETIIDIIRNFLSKNQKSNKIADVVTLMKMLVPEYKKYKQ